MQKIYGLDEKEARRLAFMYRQSDIETRYTVLADYTQSDEKHWNFIPIDQGDPLPNLDERMKIYNREALPLSILSINDCLENITTPKEITHLITVSCTGMSAPGLDLQVMEMMGLPKNIFRTSVNFMGCYAAIHALRMADSLCAQHQGAKVMVVCTELCTLHFQKNNTIDNITSSLLFGDGAAAVLITHDDFNIRGLHIKDFYSEISFKGKKDMSWELSSSGFLMTLSGYVADLIGEDFNSLVDNALQHAELERDAISHWCIHPGGKKILTAIQNSISIPEDALQESYTVLRDYGNMSSPTILFVLKQIMDKLGNKKDQKTNIFAAAFGPGLTMETFILSDD